MAKAPSFSALLLLSSAALAEESPTLPSDAGLSAVATAAHQDAEAPPLVARWLVEARGGELHVRLVMENAGEDAVSMVVAHGALAGASLYADGLDPILTHAQEEASMSRMGPMPVWAMVAAGGDHEVGRWRFRWPKDARGRPVSLEARVWTSAGPVDVVWKGAPSPAGAT